MKKIPRTTKIGRGRYIIIIKTIITRTRIVIIKNNKSNSNDNNDNNNN